MLVELGKASVTVAMGKVGLEGEEYERVGRTLGVYPCLSWERSEGE